MKWVRKAQIASKDILLYAAVVWRIMYNNFFPSSYCSLAEVMRRAWIGFQVSLIQEMDRVNGVDFYAYLFFSFSLQVH